MNDSETEALTYIGYGCRQKTYIDLGLYAFCNDINVLYGQQFRISTAAMSKIFSFLFTSFQHDDYEQNAFDALICQGQRQLFFVL